MRVLPFILSIITTSALYPSTTSSQTTHPIYTHGWKALASIASGPRQEHSVTAINETVYIIGGIEPSSSNGFGFIPTAKFEAYNTRLNHWTTLAPLPLPLNHANAASVNGKVYVLGGLNTTDPEDPTVWGAVGNSYVYDPLTKKWTELSTPMPAGTERGSAAVGVNGTKIYLAGGLSRLVATIDGPQDSVDTVSVFDTQTSTWSRLPNIPARRDHVGGAIVNNFFYVLGGRDRGNANIRSTVYALYLHPPPYQYSYHQNRYRYRWTHRAPLPTARGGVATAIIGDKIYVFGGEGNPANGSRGVFDNNEVYDTKEDTWEELQPMPVPRHGTGAVAVGNTIHIPGGGVALGGAPVEVNEAYCPPGDRRR